jgi:hypothetical protein
LVVGTIRTANEFLVFTLEGEPGFEVILLGRSVIESARDYRNNTIWDVEGLIKSLRQGNHLVENLPRLFWVCNHELLNLNGA